MSYIIENVVDANNYAYVLLSKLINFYENEISKDLTSSDKAHATDYFLDSLLGAIANFSANGIAKMSFLLLPHRKDNQQNKEALSEIVQKLKENFDICFMNALSDKDEIFDIYKNQKINNKILK